MQKISLRNTDGSWNGKLIAALISLIIVLSQQILAIFGLKFTGAWSAIVAVEYYPNHSRLGRGRDRRADGHPANKPQAR